MNTTSLPSQAVEAIADHNAALLSLAHTVVAVVSRTGDIADAAPHDVAAINWHVAEVREAADHIARVRQANARRAS